MSAVDDEVDARDSTAEDLTAAEAVHRAVRSGVRRTMILQDDELLVRHGHDAVQRWVGPYPDGGLA